jgi:steroid delta-isomerase-like uncharacterized protein
MSQDNVALLRRWFEEVWNKGRIEAMDEMASQNVVAHGHAPFDVGLDQFKEFFRTIRAAFPDIRINIDFTLSEGDKVVGHWSSTMTHTGSFLGLAPCGRQVKVHGITIMRIAGGKIVEAWDSWDQFGLLQQIGAALGHQFFAQSKSAPNPAQH